MSVVGLRLFGHGITGKALGSKFVAQRSTGCVEDLEIGFRRRHDLGTRIGEHKEHKEHTEHTEHKGAARSWCRDCRCRTWHRPVGGHADASDAHRELLGR